MILLRKARLFLYVLFNSIFQPLYLLFLFANSLLQLLVLYHQCAFFCLLLFQLVEDILLELLLLLQLCPELCDLRLHVGHLVVSSHPVESFEENQRTVQSIASATFEVTSVPLLDFVV